MIHSLYFWFYSRLRSVGIRKSQEINFSHSAPILREPNILTPLPLPPLAPLDNLTSLRGEMDLIRLSLRDSYRVKRRGAT